jgi:SAM-dependent methyltransferase
MRGVRLLQRLRVERAPETSYLPALSDEDRRYLTSLYDDSVPLPAEAEQELVSTNPVLLDLRHAYGSLDHPALASSRWNRDAVGGFLDLRWFRGESLFLWHYRELPRISRLKYFVLASYVRDRDTLSLLDRLDEDGRFGCWTYSYPGSGRVSRDLLQSVNEISFLERQLGISTVPSLRVLDIGAGYGRLAHRMVSGLSNVADYCCTDPVPEATFLSGWYLRHRGCLPPARVVRLDRLEQELTSGTFHLAVNIHSFSECPLEAIRWWLKLIAELSVPHLLIVPNEPHDLLSTEEDGSRLNFTPLLEAAGYRGVLREPVIDDPAARALLRLDDHFHLFTRA